MPEIITSAITCKNCHSTHVVKFGTYRGNQRYLCRDCNRKFKADDSLFKGKVSASDISSAMLEYYSGLSVNDIRKRILQEKGYKPSPATVYQWIDKFTSKANDYYAQFQPKVGDTWIADETVLHIHNQDIWLWDIIDEDTRFLLATKLSYTRNISDARTLFELAYKRAGKAPKVILTDKLRAYPEAVDSVFGAGTVHIQSNPFVKDNEGEATRAIERWHETLKERTKVIYGLKDTNSALAFVDGFTTYYDFIRPHEGLGDKTPAEVAGIKYDVKSWADLIRLGEPGQSANVNIPQYTIPPETQKARLVVTGTPYKVGRKRKPKTSEPKTELAGLTTVKIVETTPKFETAMPANIKRLIYGKVPKGLR